ncbi:MAG: hypothetical protein K9N51_09165 [Candidatus Pacebacteria bacterium]|nr:hypothetical protein [Candidatus Paceibacterota bacterium]
MTEQTDSVKLQASVKAILDSMPKGDILEIIAAICGLAEGITVSDDGEIQLKGHTKTKMTVTYPDGSKGSLMTMTSRSTISKP